MQKKLSRKMLLAIGLTLSAGQGLMGMGRGNNNNDDEFTVETNTTSSTTSDQKAVSQEKETNSPQQKKTTLELIDEEREKTEQSDPIEFDESPAAEEQATQTTVTTANNNAKLDTEQNQPQSEAEPPVAPPFETLRDDINATQSQTLDDWQLRVQNGEVISEENRNKVEAIASDEQSSSKLEAINLLANSGKNAQYLEEIETALAKNNLFVIEKHNQNPNEKKVFYQNSISHESFGWWMKVSKNENYADLANRVQEQSDPLREEVARFNQNYEKEARVAAACKKFDNYEVIDEDTISFLKSAKIEGASDLLEARAQRTEQVNQMMREAVDPDSGVFVLNEQGTGIEKYTGKDQLEAYPPDKNPKLYAAVEQGRELAEARINLAVDEKRLDELRSEMDLRHEQAAETVDEELKRVDEKLIVDTKAKELALNEKTIKESEITAQLMNCGKLEGAKDAVIEQVALRSSLQKVHNTLEVEMLDVKAKLEKAAINFAAETEKIKAAKDKGTLGVEIVEQQKEQLQQNYDQYVVKAEQDLNQLGAAKANVERQLNAAAVKVKNLTNDLSAKDVEISGLKKDNVTKISYDKLQSEKKDLEAAKAIELSAEQAKVTAKEKELTDEQTAHRDTQSWQNKERMGGGLIVTLLGYKAIAADWVAQQGDDSTGWKKTGWRMAGLKWEDGWHTGLNGAYAMTIGKLVSKGSKSKIKPANKAARKIVKKK